MRVISGTARGTKINSIDSIETRPTLDRVKESLFNIIQNKLEDAIVLDLFAGSGAIGIECISRGAEKAYFCEKSHQATKMVYENLIKTRLKEIAYDGHKHLLENRILPYWGNKPINLITPADIKNWQKAQISTGEKSMLLHLRHLRATEK